jgi:peptidoglycan/xylan/chitin deacetylase (PgdA/CDA1 family)
MSLFRSSALRVLMYHQVLPQRQTALCVTPEQLRAQLSWLRGQHVHWLGMPELLDCSAVGRPLPPRSVLLTFDDGYLNNAQFALPILQEFGAKATIFLPTRYIGQTNAWDAGEAPIMTWQQLRDLPTDLISLGLHTHNHRHLGPLDANEWQHELAECQACLRAEDIPFLPVLAYPYGGFPKHPQTFEAFQKVLQNQEISLAFRIGNRLNAWPLRAPFLVQRIDVRGDEPMWRFRLKIQFGKLW